MEADTALLVGIATLSSVLSYTFGVVIGIMITKRKRDKRGRYTK
jgi:amino acid transporter